MRLAGSSYREPGRVVREYLVCSWKEKEPSDEPEITVVLPHALFDVLDVAKREEHKIAVFEVGEYVLDWS